MINIHNPVKELIQFYAEELGDKTIIKVLEAGHITNESEANCILNFCDSMFDLAVKYESENKSVLGEPAKIYDVEKAYSVLNDIVSEEGFDYLIKD